MTSKFNATRKSLSPKQEALARRIQSADIASYSKVVKAFGNGDDAQIEAWKQELNAHYEANPDAKNEVKF